MKSKNIPSDIKVKSIKDAQNEIKDIFANLEDTQTNLEESIDKYTRMVQLNNHIQEKHSESNIDYNTMIIENKVIKYVAVEKETGICELSAADNVLSKL